MTARIRNSAANRHEVDHLRGRVRLYLQVMLAIDVLSRVSDLLSPIVIPNYQPPTVPLDFEIVRWAITVVLASGWAFTKFARPGRRTLILFELGFTFSLALVYVHMAMTYVQNTQPSAGPIFALFGIVLLLVVRASLVPSSALRTAAIGIVSSVHLFTATHRWSVQLDPVLLDGLSFIAGSFIIATTVTSHVIYGLRREVRQALRMGQYTLAEKLGEGGMGAVYRAEHAMLRRQAAIKLIKPELVGDGARREQALQRFEREARVTANLKSPHTIELYDYGVSTEGVFYYVMEFLDGISLEDVVKKCGAMQPGRVIHILLQVCESLEEAHAAGLVHRDIKPANIFLCRYGLRYDFAKVLDFGLVGLDRETQPGDPKLTAEGFIGGTPSYLAPEMVSGSATVDSRSDIYALGCVAYWLLTGHPPFKRESAMATILAHVNDSPTPPSQLSEIAIPASLESLVLECMAKSPTDRPASSFDLSRRLEAMDVALMWTQDQAAQWWETHQPALEPRPHTHKLDEEMEVTKAF